MTNLKNKLSASVRMAKAAQQPAATKAPAQKPQAAPSPAKAAAPTNKPAQASKSASRPNPSSAIPESGSALFPSRVWPD